jgi:pyruvate/2-oxoglutarate dehydrogenase complex dihydrolipoamide dehydrogenase (E3) component
VVVIGAGTAGLVTAAGAAGLGAKVALVEKHLLGGDCLNVGCVPSKCIIRSARVRCEVRDAARYGVEVSGDAGVDFPAVMERMRKLRARISQDDALQRFEEMGIDVFLGRARFVAPDAVEVDGARLNFSRAVVATGSRPRRLPAEGLEDTGYLTNETVFTLTERPDRLAVVGGGPLGCELAQAFQRLGSQVTILQRSGQFLRKEDPDAAGILEESFRRDGVDIRFNTTVTRVEKQGGEKLLHLDSDGEADTLAVDELLVGIGRVPNVQDLGLEAAGVEYDERRGVHVDDRLRTSNNAVYAAGDVCLKHKFTHTADASARVVIQNALFWGRKKFSDQVIPWCSYTDPEIAHVGMYEHDAEEQGIAVDTFRRPLEDVDRAIADGQDEGFVKVHVKKGSDDILGATVVASHAGDMLSELTTAMVGDLGLGTLAGVIHPYPTQAEAIKHVADSYNRSRLTPFFKGLAERLMSWRR